MNPSENHMILSTSTMREGNISLELTDEHYFNTIETPHDDTEQLQYATIQWFLQARITPLICIFGCLGNILNLMVLLMMRRCGTSSDAGVHLGLILLSLSDLLFCCFMLPRVLLLETQSLFTSYGFLLFYQVRYTVRANPDLDICSYLEKCQNSHQYFMGKLVKNNNGAS